MVQNYKQLGTRLFSACTSATIVEVCVYMTVYDPLLSMSLPAKLRNLPRGSTGHTPEGSSPYIPHVECHLGALPAAALRFARSAPSGALAPCPQALPNSQSEQVKPFPIKIDEVTSSIGQRKYPSLQMNTIQ